MQEPGATGRVGRVVGSMYLALCLIYMVWILWAVLLPEGRRLQIKLQLLRWCGQATNRLARRAGAASLRHEALTGVADYTVPYQLSLARLRLERAYENTRGVIS